MIVLVILVLLFVSPVWATTYYISPTGSNSNDGLAATTGGGHGPFLTFGYAINASRAWCGDTLLLVTGEYGNKHTTTGNINVNAVVCSQNDELTIRAISQRKAMIWDDGLGKACWIQSSAWIIIDGLYCRSTDNTGITSTGSEQGLPIQVRSSHDITVRNSVFRNPNHYGNNGIAGTLYSQRVLWEDNEKYEYHRHCGGGTQSEDVVHRRDYCNPRDGRRAGTFLNDNPVGSADSMSWYPCKNCILENSIADGTQGALQMVEMNANFKASVLVSGNKVLGSICYKCNYANGIFPNSRNTGLNGAPQKITIRDVLFINHGSPSTAINFADCADAGAGGCVIDHVSIFGASGGITGIQALNKTSEGGGSTAAQNSLAISNVLVRDLSGRPFNISGFDTFSGTEIYSYNNSLAPIPAFSNPVWSAVTTTDPGMGTCKAWIPAGSPLKGAGTGGSDIGGTVLYRYQNGILTSVPLWDPVTGEFPHGEFTDDGVNHVAGNSLFDFHTRINVNTGGCSFPAGYGSSGGPTNPSTHQSGIGTTSLSWSHTLPGGTQGLLVAVSAYDPGANVGTINTPTACAGQSVTAIPGAESVSSPAYRRTKVFGITGPNTGSCTIAASITGNASFMAGESIQIATMGSFGTPSVATALSSTPTVTVTAPSGEQIFDFLGAKCSPVSGACTTTLSFGSNQTFQKDIASAGDLRLATSNKSTNNGPMSATMGGNNYWTYVAVPVLSASPTPDTAVITQDAYQLITGYGDMDTANLLTASSNTPYSVGSEAFLRIRFRVAGSVATTQAFGSSVYCRKDADSFTRAVDTFGSNTFRLLGPGAELEHPKVPASAMTSATSRTGASNFDGAAFLRDESSVIIVPSLAVGHTYEVEAAIVLNGSNNNVYQCQLRKDDGTQLVYSQTPSVTVRPGLAGFTR